MTNIQTITTESAPNHSIQFQIITKYYARIWLLCHVTGSILDGTKYEVLERLEEDEKAAPYLKEMQAYIIEKTKSYIIKLDNRIILRLDNKMNKTILDMSNLKL
jgi:hypothetical protein